MYIRVSPPCPWVADLPALRDASGTGAAACTDGRLLGSWSVSLLPGIKGSRNVTASPVGVGTGGPRHFSRRLAINPTGPRPCRRARARINNSTSTLAARSKELTDCSRPAKIV